MGQHHGTPDFEQKLGALAPMTAVAVCDDLRRINIYVPKSVSELWQDASADRQETIREWLRRQGDTAQLSLDSHGGIFAARVSNDALSAQLRTTAPERVVRCSCIQGVFAAAHSELTAPREGYAVVWAPKQIGWGSMPQKMEPECQGIMHTPRGVGWRAPTVRADYYREKMGAPPKPRGMVCYDVDCVKVAVSQHGLVAALKR